MTLVSFVYVCYPFEKRDKDTQRQADTQSGTQTGTHKTDKSINRNAGIDRQTRLTDIQTD